MGLLEDETAEGPGADTRSDEEIFLLSQRQPQVYAILLSRYQSAFLRKAKMVMKTDEAAEDVVQETFTKIYFKAKHFESRGPGSFKSWGYKVLMNTAFTHYQKGKRGDVVAFTDEFAEVFPDMEAIDAAEQKELADYVTSILSRLPEHFAQVLNKFFLEGKSQEEIAAEEGISIGAVKTKVYRAKEAFRSAKESVAEKLFII